MADTRTISEGSRPLRVVFMGTPDFAVPSLEALARHPRVQVVLVISQPDRPRGRGQQFQPTPVKAAALALGIPVEQPVSMRTPEAHALLRDAQADLAVVAAYGQILDETVLGTPTFGCLNVHASLLPRWRGAAPIQRAIEAADAVTGVAIMQMERGLDTGPVFAMAATMIGETETAGELHDRLAQLGADTLAAHLDAIVNDELKATPQADSRATTAAKILPSDRSIDFDASPLEIAARINAMSPWPGIQVSCPDVTLTLLRARPQEDAGLREKPGTILCADTRQGLQIACRGGFVEVLELKRAGKRAMASHEFLCGATLADGTVLRPTE